MARAVADVLGMDVLICMQSQGAEGARYVFAAPKLKSEEDKKILL